jgi:hypothetical protein
MQLICWINLSAAPKYFPLRINIFLYRINLYPIWKSFSPYYLSRRDNIYPLRKKYFPREVSFDQFSKKKSEKVPLTGFEPATVKKSGKLYFFYFGCNLNIYPYGTNIVPYGQMQ